MSVSPCSPLLRGRAFPLRGFALWLYVVREPLAPRLAVPFLEGLVGNLALNEELSEFSALGLAFERHGLRDLLQRRLRRQLIVLTDQYGDAITFRGTGADSARFQIARCRGVAQSS